MVEIIGVRFQNGGKVYYFSPDSWKVKQGDLVITETSRGTECGEVAIANKQIPKEQVTVPLKPILRVATREDRRTLEQNRKKEERAFQVCQQKIAYRKLKMNLVDVECTFDNSKLLFYFTADNRVDFRELVKDLAAVFRTRIELRQIGVRDKAKILGGIGICGREFCCKGHLQDFQPVSIRMAKEQGLSLNPTKISGCCGRLMCCLKYEQNVYEELLRITPKVGDRHHDRRHQGKGLRNQSADWRSEGDFRKIRCAGKGQAGRREAAAGRKNQGRCGRTQGIEIVRG